MFGWRRKDPTPPVAVNPVAVSDHARDLLEKSKEAREVFARVLNGNSFTRSMKHSLGKKKRKR